MSVSEWWGNVWAILVAVVTIGGAVVASIHAVLYKRDTRATVLWVGFIWLAPLGGALCYLLLGINRIKRRAHLLRKNVMPPEWSDSGGFVVTKSGVESAIPPLANEHSNLLRRIRLVDLTVESPIVSGNRVTPLFNGEEAYPEMLAAIDAAQRSVVLSTYIFDRDSTGREFVASLGRAVGRGVQTRVLVDGTGARYSFPTIQRMLRKAGVTCELFLPTLAPYRTFALNMRNHRKILVVDGAVGFTGGMNIRAGHRTDEKGRLRVRDCHFKVEGPVVAQMRDVFADDWLFTTGEELDGPAWVADLKAVGDCYSRCISDGPDEALDRLRWTLLGALATAHDRVCIATPYFLPDPLMIAGLNTAALRGVSVEILLPQTNNLPFDKWACEAHLWQIL
jgi:cardiolipin synthase